MVLVIRCTVYAIRYTVAEHTGHGERPGCTGRAASWTHAPSAATDASRLLDLQHAYKSVVYEQIDQRCISRVQSRAGPGRAGTGRAAKDASCVAARTVRARRTQTPRHTHPATWRERWRRSRRPGASSTAPTRSGFLQAKRSLSTRRHATARHCLRTELLRWVKCAGHANRAATCIALTASAQPHWTDGRVAHISKRRPMPIQCINAELRVHTFVFFHCFSDARVGELQRALCNEQSNTGTAQ